MISKKTRDLAMKIICNFYQSHSPGYVIDSNYLRYQGLPKSVDADQVIKVLEAMGYVTYSDRHGNGIKEIRLTDLGQCYFERKSDLSRKERIQRIRYWITTAIAIAAFIKSFFF